jgi:hypothetical protein
MAKKVEELLFIAGERSEFDIVTDGNATIQ